MLLQVARRVAQLLPAPGDLLPEPLTCARVMRLVEEALGEELRRFPDGRMLIWDIARHDGYNIPAYPMAGCGDVREFLHDEGVRDVPSWYEAHLGINRATYDHIWAFELTMVRNRALWRRVFMTPTQVVAQGSARGGELLDAMRAWLDFALGELTCADNPALFRR